MFDPHPGGPKNQRFFRRACRIPIEPGIGPISRPLIDPQGRSSEVQVAAGIQARRAKAEDAAHSLAVRVVAARHDEPWGSAEQYEEFSIAEKIVSFLRERAEPGRKVGRALDGFDLELGTGKIGTAQKNQGQRRQDRRLSCVHL